MLNELIDTLDPMERSVIEMLWFERVGPREAGRVLGVHMEQVRRTEAKAIARLKASLSAVVDSGVLD